MASHVIESIGNSPFGGVAHAFHAARERLAAYRAEQAHRSLIARELAAYSDRDLCDLGISRSDVPAIVNGSYRRY